MSTSNQTTQERPPVIAIMGHVDHGKSSLLDYIQKTNVIDGEAGGITQHLSAYEVEHTDQEGDLKRITFIDTPGHAAFTSMRNRGATIADIAILIISAEDSVKTQTKEAISIIRNNEVPFVVAINKIDKPNANPEKVKMDLMSHNVFVEGMGGDIPVCEISAKTGDGVDNLLETILLLAALEEFTGRPELPAIGVVVESMRDLKRGITATLVIKDGSVAAGDFIVAGTSIAPTRILESFKGASIDQASFSSPFRVIGFDSVPPAGSPFQVCKTKKEAEELVKCKKEELAKKNAEPLVIKSDEVRFILPIIIKTDVLGTLEAIESEIKKMPDEKIVYKIVRAEVGDVNETDIKLALTNPYSVIIGFHVDIDQTVAKVDGHERTTIKQFDVIYHLTEWLEEYAEDIRPKEEIDKTDSIAKVLKVFSHQQGKTLLGGTVTQGIFDRSRKINVRRNGALLGKITIESLQQARSETTTVQKGGEFGAMVKDSVGIQPGDELETVVTIID